jgi:hypothetical protein
MGQLLALGFGQSTCIGIGGDPIIGTTHLDAIQLLNAGDRIRTPLSWWARLAAITNRGGVDQRQRDRR